MNEHPGLDAASLDQADWRILSSAVRRFEEAWKSGSQPSFSHLLPPPGEPIRQCILIELIKVDQEYRWRAGYRKWLEAYLAEWLELAGNFDAQVELLKCECMTRATYGDPATIAEIQSRFPELCFRIDLAALHSSVDAELREEKDVANAAQDTSRQSAEFTPSPAGTATPLAEGQLFGRYRICTLLGEGGMGWVYRAYDTQLERDVALKIPRLDAGAEQAVGERFLREAKAAARIQHPNVCSIFDAGYVDGTHYITMALIPGESLAEWMTGRTINPREAAEVVHKLAQGLEAVHSEGVVHRDIKPSNVMINRSGEPLLMDFGLAGLAEADIQRADKQAQATQPAPDAGERVDFRLGLPDSRAGGMRLTQTGDLLGTLPYMPPEQLAGTPDRRSDLYSLGVLFYRLLTGRLPFEGTPSEIMDGIRHLEPPRPGSLRPEIDSELESICLKAMAKNPADRYPSAREFAEVLGRYLQPQAARPPGRRSRLGWLLATAMAFLSLVLGVTIYHATNKGTLEITLNEPNALVRINGDNVEIDTPRDSISLRVGEYQLEVSKDGFETFTDRFTIRRGDKKALHVQLLPRQIPSDAPPGTLLFTFRSPNPKSGEGLSTLATAGNTIVIGAPALPSIESPGAGSVYLFDAKTGGLRSTISGNDLGLRRRDGFGYSVAASGDDILVGALYSDEGGRVYLFRGPHHHRELVLRCPAPQPNATFGSSVAFIGNCIVVAAERYDPGTAPDCGAVYLFDRASGALLQTLQPRPAPRQFFGKSLAIIDENSLLVGAQGDVGHCRGTVYLYELDGERWTLKASIGAPGDRYFGRSMAAMGELAIIAAWNRTYLYRLAPGQEPQLLHEFPIGGVVTTVGEDIAIVPLVSRPEKLLDARRGEYAMLFDFKTYEQVLEISVSYGNLVSACGIGDKLLLGDSTAVQEEGVVYLYQGRHTRSR